MYNIKIIYYIYLLIKSNRLIISIKLLIKLILKIK